jgi:hypothetical protein
MASELQTKLAVRLHGFLKHPDVLDADKCGCMMLAGHLTDAVVEAFKDGYGTMDCTCHDAYKGRGRHEPNAQGCPAEVAYYLGLTDG